MSPEPTVEIQPGFAFAEIEGRDEVLWDTQLSDQLICAASVLAAGQRYAYLATASGLVIAELTDSRSSPRARAAGRCCPSPCA